MGRAERDRERELAASSVQVRFYSGVLIVAIRHHFPQRTSVSCLLGAFRALFLFNAQNSSIGEVNIYHSSLQVRNLRLGAKGLTVRMVEAGCESRAT